MARKEKTIHYLYKTTCLVTNRYYIGMHSTSNLDDGYMGSGKGLRYSIRKHGKENHIKEILEFFENRDLLIEAEKKAITPEMLTDKNCMNLKEGGSGGGGFWSEKHKLNFLIAGAKNFSDSEKRRVGIAKAKQTNQYKKAVSEGVKNYLKNNKNNFKDRTHSDETKKIMSEKAKERVGILNSQFGTCWITKDGINKKIKKEDLETHLLEGWVKGRK